MTFPVAPNFILTQGHSLTAASGTWGLVRNVLVQGKIPRWMKEMVFVAISKDRGCQYCAAAHIACCRMLGVKVEHLDALLRGAETLSNPRLREMVRFALKCSREPRRITRDDHAMLRQHGMDEAEIIELIAMSGLAVYANIMADATAMEADAMFAEIR
jgi:uncharacterized peroxidase-related enzyme